METGWWWSQSISPSFCHQFVHEIILSGLRNTGFCLFDTLYAVLEATNKRFKHLVFILQNSKWNILRWCGNPPTKELTCFLVFSIYNPKFNQAQSAKRWSGAPDAGMFRSVHNTVSLLISWQNLGKHASRLSHCSFFYRSWVVWQKVFHSKRLNSNYIWEFLKRNQIGSNPKQCCLLEHASKAEDDVHPAILKDLS